MKPTRRTFLTGASALSAATLTGIGSSLSAFQASAAETSGYKAIVCLFFLGGMDGHDTVLPYDQASYDRYATIRQPLLNQYANMQGGSTRARDRLLPLTPSNAADFGGREFALTEEMSGIKGLFDNGNAAIVGNVGPLIQPLTKEQFENDSAPQPKRLFSHNDQQSTWMSSAPEGAQYGWGGRFADAALAAGANSGSRDFTTITSLGNELFLTGINALPYQIGLDGAPEIDALNFFAGGRDTPEGDAIYQKLRDHFEAMDFNSTNLIDRDVSNAMRTALTTNEAFNQAFETIQPFSTEFPGSFLGQQLQAVANTIAIRDALLVNRQVFFVAIGGFDTHSNQVNDLPNLQREIDGGVVAFYQAMQELGLGSDVTLFTASDFGRTLAINGDGTDHGWGSHHFVIGDAVQGGQIYGDIPPYDFDHDQDAGSGRLIPTTSVEQFAEPLGRWFGLTESEIADALPNLSNFSSGPSFV
ncbi:MAG: DUF1501 domain-containing protein [Hyphomonadaceae bacterium]|nr:DUF1501 domain-containing protein [Hyphomonadaceae bacterium]